MRRTSILATLAALVAIAYFSCTPKIEETEETKDGYDDTPVMREVSELVSLMFEMEADMKLIRSGLIDDSTTLQLNGKTYEELFTSKTSKDVKIDSAFVANGKSFLNEWHSLSQARTRDSALTFFNNAVNACVSCHQSYCPGPVARIKKLRIK